MISTPDPTADIPTRRFQGLVRAWRIALHEYDPPELKSAQARQPTKDCAATSDLVKDLTKVSFSSQKNGDLDVGEDECVKSKQIIEATRRGLQVEFSNAADNCNHKPVQISPSSVAALPSGVVCDLDKKQPSRVDVDFLFGDENVKADDDVWVDYEVESDDDDLL